MKKSLPDANGAVVKAGKQEFPAPREMGRLVSVGYDIKQQIRELQDQLKSIQAELTEQVQDFFVDTGTIHVLFDGVDCKVSMKDDCDLFDPDGLMTAIGDRRFRDLVDVKTTYRPTERFRGILSDPSDDEYPVFSKFAKYTEAKHTFAWAEAK